VGNVAFPLYSKDLTCVVYEVSLQGILSVAAGNNGRKITEKHCSCARLDQVSLDVRGRSAFQCHGIMSC
jgi:hypothetical protein